MSDTTLFAEWNPGYKVLYYPTDSTHGAPPINPNFYQIGENVPVAYNQSLQRTDYTLGGWTYSGMLYSEGSNFTCSGNAYLYPYWVAREFLGTLEQNMRSYLLTCSGVISAFTPITVTSGIFIIQAPTGSRMPYMVVELSEGPRSEIGYRITEEVANVRITVDSGPTQLFKGRAIIEAALSYIENYRGAFGTCKDVYCKCSSIRGWSGTGGTYRYQFTAVVQHTGKSYG
jgi:hypothetical protein